MSKNRNKISSSQAYPRFEFQEFEIEDVTSLHKIPETDTDFKNALDKVIYDHFAHLNDNDNKDTLEKNTDADDLMNELKLDQIKTESYNEGYEKAQQELQKVIDEYKVNYDIANVLNEKINSIKIVDDIDTQLLEIFSATLKEIADLMHVKLPVNFEGIISGSMLDFIKKHYESGTIKVTVHSTKVDYCRKILENKLRSNKDALLVVGSNDLELNGCVVELKDTRLVYDQEHIKENVDRIISELNIAGN